MGSTYVLIDLYMRIYGILLYIWYVDLCTQVTGIDIK